MFCFDGAYKKHIFPANSYLFRVNNRKLKLNYKKLLGKFKVNSKTLLLSLNIFTRVTRGWRGEVSPVLFRKLEKSTLIWIKNALILVIYG